MSKKIIGGIVLLSVFLLGVWMTRAYYQTPESTSDVDASVFIEQVKNVCKLVTIEADLHEVYDEKNYRNVTWYLPLPTRFSFSKKASIEVKGKVLVGYDLEKITIDADSVNKVLYIRNLPRPEILSIEHDVKYRSLDESFFNEFTASDFTRINKSAKEVLQQKAIANHLLEKAEQQGLDVLNV
ncbi:MAG TPA: DUF4230 domain-containing protein, partial [Phaeodactylibacter sp.]|nr:DUF4230 domain-containing protein [Phaeodactylibacter sp.]